MRSATLRFSPMAALSAAQGVMPAKEVLAEVCRDDADGCRDTLLSWCPFFRGQGVADPLSLRAGPRAGALASLVGIAAYQSSERGGQAVKIEDLVKLSTG